MRLIKCANTSTKHLLLFGLVCFASVTYSWAGVVLEYQGMDWMIAEADEIVIARHEPIPPRVEAGPDGKPIISNLPDVTNGYDARVRILKVLKGSLKEDSLVSIYIPLTTDFGKYPVEFPKASAVRWVSEDEPIVMFMQRTSNKPPIETLRCYGSIITVNQDQVEKLSSHEPIKEKILKVIEQNPKREYKSRDGYVFDIENRTTSSKNAHGLNVK